MKKKLLPVFSALVCLIVCMLGFTACNNFIHAATVHISTPEDLLKMADGGNFVLDNDIDCGGMTLNCISVNKDAGLTLNGNGHVIKNVKIGAQNNCFGLVYGDGDITISDLGIVDFTIDTDFESSNGKLFVGAFVALCNQHAKLTRCYANGTVDIAIKNSTTDVGGLVGYGRDCEFTDCLSNVKINAELYDVQFAKATVYGGGFVGEAGWRNSLSGYYSTPFTHCINLSSISVDTFLAISLTTRSVLGGLGGYVVNAMANECISAPEYMRVSTFITDYGIIGGIVGQTDRNQCSRSYYCNYYSDNLTESQRETLCSYYEKLNGSGAGTPVNVEKTTFFTEDFLTNEATITDQTGKIVDIFLSFDASVWNFAKEAGELPSLKCFEK